MLKRAAAIGTVLALPLVTVGVAHADVVGCAVLDTVGQCLIAAVDPGGPGGPLATPNPRPLPDPAAATSQSAPTPQELQDRAMEDLALQAALAFGEIQTPAPAQQAVATAPNLTAVAAQRAVELLELRPPSIRASAEVAGFVGVPLWLWIERGQQFTGPVSATAVAGASRVTATGRLVGVEWAMGPPGAEFRCAGPGTPWTGQRGASPDCGYVYTQRSLPERTGGTGRWSISATSVWQVDWVGATGGVPVAGGQEVRVAAQTSLAVGEVQVLVGGGGQ